MLNIEKSPMFRTDCGGNAITHAAIFLQLKLATQTLPCVTCKTMHIQVERCFTVSDDCMGKENWCVGYVASCKKIMGKSKKVIE